MQVNVGRHRVRTVQFQQTFLDEIKQGMYVYVRLKHPFKKMLEFTGEILDVNENIVHLAYRDKAATRKAEFTKEDIDFIRLAVKF